MSDPAAAAPLVPMARPGIPTEMRRRRLRFFCRAPSPHMLDFLRALAARPEVEVDAVFRERIELLKPWGYGLAGLRSEVLEWSRLGVSERFRALARLASSPTDAWILGDSIWHPVVHLFARLARRAGSRCVLLAEPLWLDSGPAGSLRGWWGAAGTIPAAKRFAARRLLRGFSAIAAMGERGRSCYEELCGDRPVFATSYVVDLGPLHALPRSPGPHCFTLGFCGQLIRRKGLDRIMPALVDLLARDSRMRLLVAGAGPLRPSLEAVVPTVLRERIVFLGFVRADRLPEAFWSRIDLLLVPSLFDGWGMVVPEALAAGVPVIASPFVGAAEEYVLEGRNGWIRELDEFVPTIARVLRERPDAVEVARRTRASVADATPARAAADFVQALARAFLWVSA